jgi:uncharacterized protein (TIGR03643 family)
MPRGARKVEKETAPLQDRDTWGHYHLYVGACFMAKTENTFNPGDTSRIIEMAWEDRTPFDAIELLYGLNESAVINLMRRQLKPSSFRMWRKRVVNRPTKHGALRLPGINRAYCPTQYKP